MLLGLVGVSVGGYFLRDALGFALRELGTIIWLLVLAVTFMLGLGYFAQFIVPAGWQEGLHLLFSFFTGGPQRRPPPAARKAAAAEHDPIADLPVSLWTMRAGLVESTTALALVRGNRFARAAGPGYVRVEGGERIGQALDLRPQLRRQEVTARTRDGIPVTTTVGVRFQLRRLTDGSQAAEMPYPYDPEAVFQATFAGRVDETRDILPWHAQLAPEAAARVVAALSNYTLDQLYGDANSSGLTLAQIREQVERGLVERFESFGVTVTSVAIAPLGVPDNVVEQRIRNWQGRWQGEMERRQGENHAQVLRAQHLARAEGQKEIIRRIAQGLEEILDAGPPASEVFAWQVLQTMESAVADDLERTSIPGELVETLDHLAALIGLPSAGSGQSQAGATAPPALPGPDDEEGAP
jgi:hypothetical protein